MKKIVCITLFSVSLLSSAVFAFEDKPALTLKEKAGKYAARAGGAYDFKR